MPSARPLCVIVSLVGCGEPKVEQIDEPGFSVARLTVKESDFVPGRIGLDGGESEVAGRDGQLIAHTYTVEIARPGRPYSDR